MRPRHTTIFGRTSSIWAFSQAEHASCSVLRGSRFMALFDAFLDQLSRPDVVYLAEIYAAREKNPGGISSALLADKLPNGVFFPTFAEIEHALRVTAEPGDIILTVGAGDVYKIGESLLKK